jgi:hypothetical protein
MKYTKDKMEISPRTKLRLAEIERLIRSHRIVIPPISRRRLHAMCDEGIFDVAPRKDKHSPVLVYEDSFLRWVRELDGKC